MSGAGRHEVAMRAVANPAVGEGAERPTLRTERLVLRPFRAADASAVQAGVADREVAKTTLALPHPYPENGAAAWIATHEDDFLAGRSVHFAMERREDGRLVGQIDIRPNFDHGWGEIGYLVYREFWGRGYASEAARAVVAYGFERLGLRRVEAHHFDNNPASGRVLRNAGMTFEGTMRRKIFRWGEFHDVHLLAILREEFMARGEREGAAASDPSPPQPA